jgi:hypothetical protein
MASLAWLAPRRLLGDAAALAALALLATLYLYAWAAAITRFLLGGRGLHSSSFQLNLSALYGTGGARKGCVARVQGVLGGV